MTRASYYLLSLGLIMAIPTLASGMREAGVAVNKGGLYESDATGTSVRLREKFKPMIAHIIINDIQLGLATLVWYKRRVAAKNTLAGKLGVGSLATGAAAYAPETWMIVTEGICFLLLMMGANAGGVLVYNFGMGFSAASSGGKKKQ